MTSFWDHLDELRSVLIRCVVAWAVCAAAMFCLRDYLFAFLFWPAQEVSFINIELAAQFTTHLEVAALAGLVLAFPFILWQLYGFVAPALYANEKRAAGWIIGGGTILFFAGLALNYFVIFPFAFHFLSTYQVSPLVVNRISLRSYVSSLLVLSLVMGVLFEMPMVAWALAKAGLLHADTLRQYRKHALVGLMILAAVITPTGDAFTLLLVTIPLYLLYEISILVVRRSADLGRVQQTN